MHRTRISFLSILPFVLLTLLPITPSYAQPIIRDSEIERTIRAIATPIFSAAGLAPENINIFITQDDQVNAYVANGLNMYLNTGLLVLSDDPLLIAGVIAHESGHIASGHLTKTSDELGKASAKATLGYILGIGAAALGSPEAAGALISGGSHIAERQLLRYTRQNEDIADQSALDFLDKNQYSAKGLLDLLEYLNRQESLLYDKLNPYTLTHPLTKERMARIRDHLSKSPYAKKEYPTKIKKEFQRSITKLSAFLSPPKETLAKYKSSDNSELARYARAIAYYKIPDLASSLKEMDSLINESPHDPYYQELKGQILLENGKIKDAIQYYQHADQLLPGDPLILAQLGRAQVAAEDPKFLPHAIKNLQHSLTSNPEDAFAWRQIAIAYGRNGELGMSNLALAEEAILRNKKDDAAKFLKLAKGQLAPGSSAMIRANDLQSVLDKK